MKTPWCVLRISLFPEDFAPEAASPAQRALFRAALDVAGVDPGPPQEGAPWDPRELYAARVRSRPTPRGLFAAAALALPGGAPASLADVEVEETRSREDQRLDIHSGGDDSHLVTSSRLVFHADAAVLYTYNRTDHDFDAARLEIPPELGEVLRSSFGGPRGGWITQLTARGHSPERASQVVEELVQMGVLEPRRSPTVWNGAERPHTQALAEVVTRRAAQPSVAQRPGARGQQRHSGENAFATFRRPLVMPPLTGLREVATLLARTATVARSRVAPVLADWLDGRWMPMVELERAAPALLSEAERRPFDKPSGADLPWMEWIRERAMEEVIDLEGAPPPPREWSGSLVLATEWTDDGHLLEPFVFAPGPRELLGRYAVPGLPERLAALDASPPALLAYHGARSLGDVAEIYAPGARALEYCGYGSDPARALRLDQLEVTSSGQALIFRLAATREIVRLCVPVPWNEDLPYLHPLVRLLLAEARTGLPEVQLFKTALQDFPVRPRIVWRGHILRRRRVGLPRHLREEDLAPWLEDRGLAGPVAFDDSRGRLVLHPREDDAVRRAMFKALRAGSDVRVSELPGSAGVVVDGRAHSAHALVPVVVGSPPRAVTPPDVSPPRHPRELRGPFLTFTFTCLPERAPRLMRELTPHLVDSPFFYALIHAHGEVELRLRVPSPGGALSERLQEVSQQLLDERLIRRWALGPYLREWDRYGGEEDLPGVEAFFVADSQSLALAFAHLGLRDLRRTDLLAHCVLQTLRLAGLSLAEAAAFCRRSVDAWGKEHGVSPTYRKELGEEWRQRRAQLPLSPAELSEGLLSSALRQREEALRAWLLPPGRQELLRRHLGSLLHMTGTRLHFESNRWEEGRAFFFASHTLAQARATRPA